MSFVDVAEPATRRITVYFDSPGDGLVLEYAATAAQAFRFAAAAVHSGLAVTVDSMVRPGLRPLPCRILWC
ncbi:MAG: hypothetical protein J2P18_12165 [Nocardia sp.]|nr:hypothetical protein [Nocardia sp.]